MNEYENAPLHPGQILKEEFIDPLNLTIKEVAAGLKINRVNLSQVVNQRTGISPELAVKLSEAFGNSAEYWVNLQKKHELWKAELKVNRNEIVHFSTTAKN